MEKTLHKFPEIEEIIREQGYKFVCVYNSADEVVIPYNSIKNNGLKKKIDEIRTRIKRLPPGLYSLNAKTVYNSNAKGDRYYFAVGKVRPEDLAENPGSKVVERIIEKSSSDKLSIDNALENYKEIATLRSENARLKMEVEKLKDEISDLEDELDNPETMGDPTESGLGKLFKESIPIFETLTEKYFNMEEKKLNFSQVKLLADNGYEIPGAKKIKQQQQPQPNQQQQQKEIPRPGSPDWNEYISYLLELDEETFNAHLLQVRENDLELYHAIEREVFTEDEPEEETE